MTVPVEVAALQNMNSVTAILARGEPFKIAAAVVLLISIDVIHLMPRGRWLRHEGFRHESMNGGVGIG